MFTGFKQNSGLINYYTVQRNDDRQTSLSPTSDKLSQSFSGQFLIDEIEIEDNVERNDSRRIHCCKNIKCVLSTNLLQLNDILIMHGHKSIFVSLKWTSTAGQADQRSAPESRWSVDNGNIRGAVRLSLGPLNFSTPPTCPVKDYICTAAVLPWFPPHEVKTLTRVPLDIQVNLFKSVSEFQSCHTHIAITRPHQLFVVALCVFCLEQSQDEHLSPSLAIVRCL